MKYEIIGKLDLVLEAKESIKLHIDEVYQLRKQMDEFLTDDERTIISHKIRSRVQQEAESAFLNSGGGCIFMATGTGKSKIAVDISVKKLALKGIAKILIVVPTEKLRDENWLAEYSKWGKAHIWEHHVERCCYASLSKYENQDFDLVILDEGHNITENNSVFFENNKVISTMVLTATRPKDVIKISIFKSLGLSPIYELSLDESVKLGLVSPYDITVITMNLDNINKYIPAGSKAKPFMNTEKGQYGYLSTRLKAMPNQMGFINRMRFIYDLKSKTDAAKWILDNIVPKELRTLIFCGSKNQANQLCEHRFYSKPNPPKKLAENATAAKIRKYSLDFEKYQLAMKEYQGDVNYYKFMSGEINRLACVEALNEGQNIDGMDIGFVVQLNRNEKNLVQRIGRLIRFRPGHIGKVIILCVQDSVDKDWVKEASVNFDSENIKFIELSHLKAGIEKLLFN